MAMTNLVQQEQCLLPEGGWGSSDMIVENCIPANRNLAFQEIKSDAQTLCSQQRFSNVIGSSARAMKPQPLSQKLPKIGHRPTSVSSSAMPHISLPENMGKYWGMGFDKMTNKVFVSDKFLSKVHILDFETGQLVGELGQTVCYTAVHQSLFRPSGIAVDNMKNRVLVVDKDHHRVSMFSLSGQYLTSFGTRGHGLGQFEYPWDVDVSPLGDTVAVTDSRNHRVQFFNAYGSYITHYSVFENNPFEYRKYFDYPRGITYDSDGSNVFVSDFNSDNVVKIEIETLASTVLIPPQCVKRPQGMCRDMDGNILLADSRNNCVRMINPAGDLLRTNFGPSPANVCKLRLGQVGVLTGQGKIYII